jgi:hypothetical protein
MGIICALWNFSQMGIICSLNQNLWQMGIICALWNLSQFKTLVAQAWLAQLAERESHNLKVDGSIPPSRTFYFLTCFQPCLVFVFFIEPSLMFDALSFSVHAWSVGRG